MNLSNWRLALPAVAPLFLRFALAIPFLRSGLTKWEGFGTISESNLYLFAEEFRLHLLGRSFPLPAPTAMAWGSAIAEIVLPALLIIGLAVRPAAFGLLIMTGVIQLVVPDAWINFHLPWAAMALALVAWGGGPLSIDQVWRRYTERGAKPISNV